MVIFFISKKICILGILLQLLLYSQELLLSHQITDNYAAKMGLYNALNTKDTDFSDLAKRSEVLNESVLILQQLNTPVYVFSDKDLDLISDPSFPIRSNDPLSDLKVAVSYCKFWDIYDGLRVKTRILASRNSHVNRLSGHGKDEANKLLEDCIEVAVKNRIAFNVIEEALSPLKRRSIQDLLNKFQVGKQLIHREEK